MCAEFDCCRSRFKTFFFFCNCFCLWCPGRFVTLAGELKNRPVQRAFSRSSTRIVPSRRRIAASFHHNSRFSKSIRSLVSNVLFSTYPRISYVPRHTTMSQFAFVNDLKNAVVMNDPITNGPAPRWMKKSVESTSRYVDNVNLSRVRNSNSPTCPFSRSSMNTSRNKLSTSVNSKPSKDAHDLMPVKKTPSKTPKKSPGLIMFLPVQCTH